MTDPKDGGAAFPTNNLTAIRARYDADAMLKRADLAGRTEDADRETFPGLHFCNEWDGLPIWAGSPEWDACMCGIVAETGAGKEANATILSLCDEVERLRADREQGGKDYCNLSDQRDALWVENERLRAALKSLVDLNDNYSPFGGEIYQDRIERTWNSARAALGQEGDA